jgi:CheY-like chemotaxis protein
MLSKTDVKTTKAAEPSEKAAPFTVMIVDDVQDIRELYERFFEYEGARVITAADGVSALQVVLFHRPDVIILDIAMPRFTGIDVIRSLKGDPRTREIPVVVVSGHHDIRKAALEAGADAYVRKPVLPDQLLEQVKRTLRGVPSSS